MKRSVLVVVATLSLLWNPVGPRCIRSGRLWKHFGNDL